MGRFFSMNVTVYTQNNCQPCRLTKIKLDRLGIRHGVVGLDDAESLAFVRGLGYSSAPVVVVDMGDGASWSWQGYRPSELEKLEQLAASASTDSCSVVA